MDMGSRVCAHLGDILPLAADIYGRMHRHKRSNITDCVQYLSAGLDGNPQTFPARYLGNPPVFVRDTDNAKPGRRFLPDHDFSLADIPYKMNKECFPMRFDHQLGLAGNQLHWRLRRMFKKNTWMSDNCRQSLFHVKNITADFAASFNSRLKGGANFPVLIGKVGKLIRLRQSV